MKGKMSALEAAMLGLYLLGMKWICKCRGCGGSYAVACDAKPEKEDFWCGWDYSVDGSWFWDLEGDPNEPVLLDELSRNNDLIEILPWLTAHGITPPEITDTKED